MAGWVEADVLAAVEFCAKQRDVSDSPKNTIASFKQSMWYSVLAFQTSSILQLVRP
jgi:hypothetical protein